MIAHFLALPMNSNDSLRAAIRLGDKINRRRHIQRSAEHAAKHGQPLLPIVPLSIDEVEEVIERSILICYLLHDIPVATLRAAARAQLLDRPWWPDDDAELWVPILRTAVNSGRVAPRLTLCGPPRLAANDCEAP